VHVDKADTKNCHVQFAAKGFRSQQDKLARALKEHPHAATVASAPENGQE
jgi:hypothetical protein